MKTPDTTPSNSIDFEPVSIEDAAKVASPAEQSKLQPELTLEEKEVKFAAPVQEKPIAEEVVARVEELKSQISTPTGAPAMQEKMNMEPQTSENNPTLREIAEKYAPDNWKPSRHDAAYSPNDIRSNLEEASDLAKRDLPKGAVLLGTGALLAGLSAYGFSVGAFSVQALLTGGAVALAPVGIVGIPMIAALGAGGYMCHKAFKTWNDKRKGMKVLEREGFGPTPVAA
jgi:hypothetical protein